MAKKSNSLFGGLMVALAGFGFAGMILAVILTVSFALFGLVASVYGIVLAFKASIVLGLVVLVVEPTPFIIGAVYLLTGTDLAQRVVQWAATL